MPKLASKRGSPPSLEPDPRRAESHRLAQKRYCQRHPERRAATIQKYNNSTKARIVQRHYNRTAKAKARIKRYLATPGGKIMRHLVEQNPARILARRLHQQEIRNGTANGHRHRR